MRARDDAARAIESDDRKEGQTVVERVLSLTRKMPNLARGRARLENHRDDIIDGRDLVLLTERELMAPLDQEARRLISNAAKRVSVITAVSPRASVDMLFVLFNAVSLIRKLATLYGARPGMLGFIRLVSPCHFASGGHRRHGRDRQHHPADDRPRRCRQVLGAAG